MDIGTIAALADILGAVGIVGSLIFPAVHVRKNTHTLHSYILESYLDRLAVNFSRPLDGTVAAVIDKPRGSYGDPSASEKKSFSTPGRANSF